MSDTVADVIISVFEKAGVKRCYGLPGDTLNHVGDAIRRSDIRFVLVRHEEVGGFAAGADSLLTGELTLCAGSCGPGGLHFINGLYDAHRSRCPVVLIASQIVRGELGFDFPQEVDFKSVYAASSVFCDEVRTPDSAQRMAAMAAQAALSRRGVAVLILSADLASAKVGPQPGFRVHRTRPVVRPSDAELDQLATALEGSGRVAIYGGSGCEQAHDQVVALAERLKAPVAYTSRAKDFLEHDNPFAVGMTGVFGVESGYETLMTCDTLLLLGCDFAWRQFYPERATILQVDIDGTHVGRRHPVDLGVVGDIAATLNALIPRVTPREDRRFLDQMRARREKAYATLAERATPGHGGTIHPQYLAALIARNARPDAIFTADGGSPIVWLLRHIPATGQNRTVMSLTHGTMANAMPHALGAAAAFPERQVIALSGDGGIAMLLGDLLTAVQEKLPIKVVVFNNSSLAFVELEQKVEGLLNSFTDLQNPDFGEVARAMGLWGQRVERAENLEDAVRDWLAVPGPALLDVLTDRFELVMPPHVTASQVFGTVLYSAKALLDGRTKDVAALISHAVTT
jgi:pyruvate dehydrogenase (quinone)